MAIEFPCGCDGKWCCGGWSVLLLWISDDCDGKWCCGGLSVLLLLRSDEVRRRVALIGHVINGGAVVADFCRRRFDYFNHVAFSCY